MPRTAIARSAAEMESLGAAWERLHRDGGYSLFQSFSWNLLAARIFASREAPRVVHVESGSGEAIVPACIRADGRLGLLGETLFDYRDVLVAGDRAVLRQAWEALAGEGRDLAVTALAGDGARGQWEGMGFSSHFFCNAPRARPADCSAAEFGALHSRARIQLRRLRQAGGEFRVRTAEAPLVKEIYRRKAQQTDIPGNLFADPLRVEFGIAIALMDPRCEVFTAEVGTELAGALLTYRDGNVRRLYTTCYDQRWANYSPGIGLLFQAARRSLEQGMECDYMTGEQSHKARFATWRVPLYHVKATAEQLADVGRGKVELAA